MKTTKLSAPIEADQLALLREVLDKRAPESQGQFVERAIAGTLGRKDRLRICEFIGAEFAETGVDAEDEPTQRGRLLEDLLDTINRPNLRVDRA